MKSIQSIVMALLIYTFCPAQPNLTLWITPDGYHDHHQHGDMQEYFCDSSYYLFYQNGQDSLFITLKNEGTEALEITSLSTQSFAGASFRVVGFTPQSVLAGEMMVVKLYYQLPPTYVDGINGRLDIVSDDPANGNCSLYFDVGCGADWNTTVGDAMGVEGGCSSPVIWVADGSHLSDPNMVYDDSMTFYTYETGFAAHKVMKMDHKANVFIPNALLVEERFEAGARVGNPSNMRVDSNKVQIAKDLDVDGTALVDGFLDVKANAKVQGSLEVFQDVTVGGVFEVNDLTMPSDLRLKEEVSPLKDGIGKIMQLRPKSYDLKKNRKEGRRHFGFIAQQLETAIPEVVLTSDDGLKSINYIELIPWLTSALQEQQELITKLEKRIKVLEAKNATN